MEAELESLEEIGTMLVRARAMRAIQANIEGNTTPPPKLPEGSLGRLIEDYLESDAFNCLAKSTQRHYRGAAAGICDRYGLLALASLTEEDVHRIPQAFWVFLRIVVNFGTKILAQPDCYRASTIVTRSIRGCR